MNDIILVNDILWEIFKRGQTVASLEGEQRPTTEAREPPSQSSSRGWIAAILAASGLLVIRLLTG